jgi:hypothetical protein
MLAERRKDVFIYFYIKLFTLDGIIIHVNKLLFSIFDLQYILSSG